jgi:YD repeat-containing protein
MHAAGLRGDICSTMRRSFRARSPRSGARFVRKNLVTSTFQYDNNGNLTQKTTDGTATTYQYNYANRLIAFGVAGATTTYGYDAFGARVLQTGTSTTNIYPFKWYSVASSAGSGAKYSTTTEYAFNGDTLLSTTDQQFASGAATGTAKTRYIHPDHLSCVPGHHDRGKTPSNTIPVQWARGVITLDFQYASSRGSQNAITNVPSAPRCSGAKTGTT